MKINDELIIKDDSKLSLLREKSVDVNFPLSNEDKELLDAMIEYVDKSTNEELAIKEKLKPAVGISAIQVGINKKMFVVIIKNEDNEIIHQYALVNPKIISESTQQSYLETGEGCLSVNGKHQGFVYRSARIKIKAYNYLTNKEEIIKASGYLAIVLQHEYDHLNGVLFYDRINKNAPFVRKQDAISI